jgi:hypothetical protein
MQLVFGRAFVGWLLAWMLIVFGVVYGGACVLRVIGVIDSWRQGISPGLIARRRCGLLAGIGICGVMVVAGIWALVQTPQERADEAKKRPEEQPRLQEVIDNHKMEREKLEREWRAREKKIWDAANDIEKRRER